MSEVSLNRRVRWQADEAPQFPPAAEKAKGGRTMALYGGDLVSGGAVRS